MIRFPKAKINLGLFITEKRSDGYHNIESLFVPIDLFDALEAVQANHHACHLTVAGLEIVGASDDNLIVRAWKLLNHRHGIGGVDCWLVKRIPMGAGLGGGSSNGAHMLLLLNDLFNLKLSISTLEVYAAELGSDCPFFIGQVPALVSGRGERLQPIDFSLAGYHLALIHPGVHVSTKDAYAMVRPASATPGSRPDHLPLAPLADLPTHPIGRWHKIAINDFQEPVSVVYPQVKEALETLENAGALFTSMSGSGAAVYGIFDAPASLSVKPEWVLHSFTF